MVDQDQGFVRPDRRREPNGPNYAEAHVIRAAETREVAEAISRQVWGDGPRRRQKPSQDFRLTGHTLWSGWPADERLACWKKLLADICPDSTPWPRHNRTGAADADRDVEPMLSPALLELARKAALG